MTRLVLSLILCLYTFVSSAQYTQYVNPFIGTGGHGHTFPGAVVPFGMVALSPDTRIDGSWDGCSGYHYSDSIIYGFSHTHLSGTGCSDLGDIMLMPTSQATTDKNIYSSKFSHKFESAKAGMYDVYLSDDKINVSLTATARCGFHEYKWNNTDERKIVLDLRHRDELLDGEIEIVSPTKIEGYRRSKAWAVDQWCFYSIEFSEPIKVLYNADGTDIKPDIGTKLTGKNVAACFVFSAGTQMMVKVGISGTDKQGARKNLQAEITDWDFQTIYNQADNLWNKELSCIEVDNISQKRIELNHLPSGETGEGPNSQKRNELNHLPSGDPESYSGGEGPNDKYVIFYTSLYHCFIHPSINNDVDHRYRGRDGKIHIADSFDYYTVFSLWDTYRALHPLFNIVQRKRNLDFIKTFLAHYDQVGRLPIWELWGNETDCMIGYHAVSVIADAYSKGIRGFDIDKAYKAMTSIANSNWRGLDIYRKKGYLEVEDESESVSKTLEYSYDDWCIAQMGRKDQSEYIKRSNGFFNLFDKETGFNRPRTNGGWMDKFNPYEVNNNYTEANAWQYMFGMQHMLDGMKIYVGRNQIERMLDSMFSTTSNTAGREQADISGMLGQYAHGNEPSHHLAYMYNIIDKPWKTDSIVHLIIDSFYKNKPDGLIGNEDCGQMSAWYVFSSIGLYPICPSSRDYTFVAPSFDTVLINTINNKKMTIFTHNKSNRNKYLFSIDDQMVRYKKRKKDKYYEKTRGYYSSSFSHYSRLYTDTIDFNFDSVKPPRSKFHSCAGCEYGQLASHLDTFIASPIIYSSNSVFKNSISIKISQPQLEATGFLPFESPININRYLAIQISNNPPIYTLKKEYNLVIDKNTTIKTWIHQDADKKLSYSKITTANFYKILHDWTINISSTPHPQYTANTPDALIDGLRGSTDWRKGRWQGYQGQDLELVLDLQKVQTVNEVGGSFLQDVGPWIMMPKELIVYTSNDNINFTQQGNIYNTIADTVMETTIQNIIYKFPKPIQARYIKIKAINYGKLPQWHVSQGEPAYIFVDEVWVK